MEEKADPSSRLVANTVPLTLVARDSEHQRRACAWRWGDDNPALAGREAGVFKNREAEDIAEKDEPVVVARNQDRDVRETLQHGRALSAHMIQPLGDIDAARGQGRRGDRPFKGCLQKVLV